MRRIQHALTAVLFAALACSSDTITATTTIPDAASDASPDSGITPDAAPTDASGTTPCPTAGKGAVVATGTNCLTVTPAQTGASASGENATFPSYALAPDSNRNGQLVLFLNPSLGHPGNVIPDPSKNFYVAATSLGYSVIGISYASQSVIGSICKDTDSCFGPTRETILRGAYQTGASDTFQSIQTDEGAIPRLVMLLRWLVANDPTHGWDAFLLSSSDAQSADQQIIWSKVITAGHSQGGGHAAMMGKLFPVSRVIQLSSTCDQVQGVPASWTTGSVGTWQSNPADFYGLAAPTTFSNTTPTGGDVTCPYHALVWKNLGMATARSNDAAATCGMSGDTHTASIGCTDNFAAWQSMLQ